MIILYNSHMENVTIQQLLRDQNIPPTDGVLDAALGDSYSAYTKLAGMLIDLEVQPEWRYYNDGKAWLCKCLYKWKSSRGTDKEKTVFWLSVWDGFFKISFFIGEKSRTDLQNISLSESTKSMIADAKTIGKLKFFPLIFDVRSDASLDDISALIDFQKSR